MRCSAALTWRLPERVSRKRRVLPDQTGCGAAPFQLAYALLERKRRAPAVSPTILAALSAPQPAIASSDGTRRMTIRPISRSSSRARWLSSRTRGSKLARGLGQQTVAAVRVGLYAVDDALAAQAA
jgi:hypothetical protein